MSGRTAFPAHALAWFPALVVLGATAFTVASLTPSAGGVDLFAYVCFARDSLTSQGASPARFAYFPGVFAFWSAVLAVFGESLAVVQRAIAGLVLVNGLLVGLVVALPGWRLRPALFAAGATVLLSVPLEAFFGPTELLVTLPILVGLLVWRGLPLAGGDGLLRALALGVSFGAAVFVKQQAVLVALGWLVLARDAVRDPRERTGALLVPVAAIVTALVLLAVSGGLAGTLEGLHTAARYGTSETSSSLVPAMLALVLALGVAFAVAILTRSMSAPAHRVLAFALAGGLAALPQLILRPYKHYALLAVPFVVLALGLLLPRGQPEPELRSSDAGPGAGPSIRPLTGPTTTASFALVLLALALAFLGRPGPHSLADPEAAREKWPLGSSAQSELAAIKGVLPPGELLVLPPRNALVYFQLARRADAWPQAYFWGGSDRTAAVRALDNPKLTSVLVTRGPHEEDLASGIRLGVPEAVDVLPSKGFVRARELPSMTLWLRR